MDTYHVVYSGNMIQAVYGAALQGMALDKAKDIQKQVGLIINVATIQCATKPHVRDPYPFPGARIVKILT
jgi:hypothetical protein